MQSTVGPLLLVTSAVVMTCLVVTYAVNISIQAIQNPDVLMKDSLRQLGIVVNNQTSSMLNQTQTPNLYDSSSP